MRDADMFAAHAEECQADLALHALNALTEAEREAVELRLRSGCPYCLAQCRAFSQVTEYLCASVAPVQPPAGLKNLLMDRIPDQSHVHEVKSPEKRVVRNDEGRWLRLPIPGVQMRRLLGDKTFLLKMEAGASFPAHEHKQYEQCYVLEGTVTDSDGLRLEAGDFIGMAAGITHDPIRTDTGCLLLIAYAQ